VPDDDIPRRLAMSKHPKPTNAQQEHRDRMIAKEKTGQKGRVATVWIKNENQQD
jgi:hypothetical protein